PTRSSTGTRPAWSTRCSTRWRAVSARASSRPRPADGGVPSAYPSPMVARKKTSRGSAEDRLIARHFRPLATHPGALGLVDDAAVVKVPPARQLLLTADASLS